MRSTKGSIAIRSLRMALVMLLSFLMDIHVDLPSAAETAATPSRISYCQSHEGSPHHSDPARLSIEKDASEEIEVASHKRKAEAFDNITTALSTGAVIVRRPVWALRDENPLLACPIELFASSLHSQAPPRV